MISISPALAVVLLAVAWVTAGGVAVRSVSRIWLRHWAERRLSGGGAATLYLERPQRLLASAGLGVAVILLIGGMILGSEPPTGRLFVRGIIFAALVIVFGQIIPRAIARRWPAALAPIVLPVLGAFEFVSRPHATFGRMIARRGKTPEQENADDASRDAIHDLLREGELEGIGEREEIAIISGVVEFSEKEVAKIMRPRADIFSIDEDTPPHDLAIRIAAAGYSRVPVYRGPHDNIIGMVHAFDVLKSYGEAMPRIRPVAFAAPTNACNELLFRMLRSRLHLAIIRDADQKVLGLVTLEDLLETLVGDIRDEHDEPAPISKQGERAGGREGGRYA
jgi:putative hemolysin